MGYYMFLTYWSTVFIPGCHDILKGLASHNVHTHLMYEVQVSQIGLMMVQYEPKHVAFCTLINCMYQLCFDEYFTLCNIVDMHW
jgi:hypothetical protein